MDPRSERPSAAVGVATAPARAPVRARVAAWLGRVRRDQVAVWSPIVVGVGSLALAIVPLRFGAGRSADGGPACESFPALAMTVRAELGVPCAAAAGGATGADDLIAQALTRRRQGQDGAALPLLQRAYARARTPRAAAQLGFVEEALGLWVGAEAHLFEAITARRDPWIRQNAHPIEEALQAAHAHVGLIRVDVNVAGADVFVDGASVGRSPLRAGVRVATGPRRVEVRAAGFHPHVETPTVTAGKTASLFVRLQRAATSAPPPLRARAAPAR